MPTSTKKAPLLSTSVTNGPYYANKSSKTLSSRPTLTQQNAQLILAIASLEQALRQKNRAAEQNYQRLQQEIFAVNNRVPALRQAITHLNAALNQNRRDAQGLNHEKIVLSNAVLEFLAIHPELTNPQQQQTVLSEHLAFIHEQLALAQAIIDVVLQSWSALKPQKIFSVAKPCGAKLLMVNGQRQAWLDEAQFVVNQLDDYQLAFSRLVAKQESLIGQLRANRSIFEGESVVANAGLQVKAVDDKPMAAPCSMASTCSTCSSLTATPSFTALYREVNVLGTTSPETHNTTKVH